MRLLLTRAVLVGATAWLTAAGVTGTVAWRAVSVLNAGAESTGLLSGGEVRSALTDAQNRAAAATPRPLSSAFPTITPGPTSATEIARTWALTGGTVGASCTGAAIALLYATPQDGWTVEVHSAGPDGLEVELHQGEQEVVLRAQCVDGEPLPQVDESDDSRAEVSPAPAPGTPTRTPTTTAPSAIPTPSPRESEDEHAEEEDDHSSPRPSPSPETHR